MKPSVLFSDTSDEEVPFSNDRRARRRDRAAASSAAPRVSGDPPRSDTRLSFSDAPRPTAAGATGWKTGMHALFAEDAVRAQQTRTRTMRYDEAARQDAAAAQIAAAVARAEPLSGAPSHPNGGHPTRAEVGKGEAAIAHKGDDNEDDSDEGAAVGGGAQRRGWSNPTAHAPDVSGSRNNNNNSSSSSGGSPLVTAFQALVQAYDGDAYAGTCVAALCVPNTRYHRGRHSSGSIDEDRGDGAGSRLGPLLALVDATKRTRCRVPLRRTTLPQLSSGNPQYVSFTDLCPREEQGGSSVWSLMFRDRREAVEFVVAAHAILAFAPDTPVGRRADVITLLTPPPPPPQQQQQQLPEADTASPPPRPDEDVGVRRGRCSLFGYRLWLLARVGGGRSPYLCVGKTVEEVPIEAPQEHLVGDGTWMDGLEQAAVGMRAGEARLAFLFPPDTRVRRGVGNPEVDAEDAVAAYLFCAHTASTLGCAKPLDGFESGAAHRHGDGDGGSGQAVSGTLVERGQGLPGGAPPPPRPPAPAWTEDAAPSVAMTVVPTSAPAGATAPDTNALLQQLLLQRLLQGESQTRAAAGEATPQPQPAYVDAVTATAAAVERVERATDRMQAQLLTLASRLDRVDLPRALAENNAALERAMRRVVGIAPQDDAAVAADASKDRDALLATLERYRARCEEANDNYHKALEAIGRYADRVKALEEDLRVQRETYEARLADVEERARLRALEASLQHRAELERVTVASAARSRDETARERGAARRPSSAHAGGDGEDSAGVRSGGDEATLRARCAALEQDVLRWRTEVQEAQGRHLRERRALRAEIDSLALLCERMGAQQEDLTVRVPEESAERQCKRLKRALNAVYANVEAQLAALTTPTPSPASLASAGGPHDGLSTGSDRVAIQDALSALIVAIKSEARTFTQEIKTEAALRASENAMLTQLRADRREAAAAAARPPDQEVGRATTAVRPTAEGGSIVTGEQPHPTAAVPPPPPLPTSAGALLREGEHDSRPGDDPLRSIAHDGPDSLEPRRSTRPFTAAVDGEAVRGAHGRGERPEGVEERCHPGDGVVTPHGAEMSGWASGGGTPVGRPAVRLDLHRGWAPDEATGAASADDHTRRGGTEAGADACGEDSASLASSWDSPPPLTRSAAPVPGGRQTVWGVPPRGTALLRSSPGSVDRGQPFDEDKEISP